MEEFKKIYKILFDEDFKAINEKLLLNDKNRKLWLGFNFQDIVKKAEKVFLYNLCESLDHMKIVEELNFDEDFIALMKKHEVKIGNQAFFAIAFLLREFFLCQNMTEERSQDRDDRSPDDRSRDDSCWRVRERDDRSRDDSSWRDDRSLPSSSIVPKKHYKAPWSTSYLSCPAVRAHHYKN